MRITAKQPHGLGSRELPPAARMEGRLATRLHPGTSAVRSNRHSREQRRLLHRDPLGSVGCRRSNGRLFWQTPRWAGWGLHRMRPASWRSWRQRKPGGSRARSFGRGGASSRAAMRCLGDTRPHSTVKPTLGGALVMLVTGGCGGARAVGISVVGLSDKATRCASTEWLRILVMAPSFDPLRGHPGKHATNETWNNTPPNHLWCGPCNAESPQERKNPECDEAHTRKQKANSDNHRSLKSGAEQHVEEPYTRNAADSAS